MPMRAMTSLPTSSHVRPWPRVAAQSRAHAIAVLLDANERHGALDAHAGLPQPVDQQPLVLVLGKDDGVGKRTEPDAAVAEERARHAPGADPEVHRHDPDAALDH